MFGYALSLSRLESLGLYVVFGLAVACALVATLLLIGQLAAAARKRDGESSIPASSLPRFLVGLGCALAAIAVVQMIAGAGLAEDARSTIGSLRAD